MQVEEFRYSQIRALAPPIGWRDAIIHWMDDTQPELQGLPQYMRDPMKPRHTLRIFFIVAAIFLLGGSAWGLVRFSAIFEDIRSEEDMAATLARERTRRQ